jgi:sugar lactone lactonase YvrE
MQAQPTTGNSQRLALGEGPVWDVEHQRLWWVDSEAGQVFRGLLEGTRLEVEQTMEMGEKVGSVTPAGDGGLLVAVEHHVLVVDPRGQIVEGIRVLPDGLQSRLNDGTCDPVGRFLVGSVRLDGREADESLWAIGPGGTVRQVVSGISVSNGIGFSPDGGTMYYVESRPGTILAFDYDVVSGAATNRREVLASGGTPDGLAVDVEGNVWVAFFGEGEVRCISPGGDVLARISVDAPNVTCPEFAGAELDQLVITTARFRMDEHALEQWPLGGATFIAQPGVAGLAPTVWAGSTQR